MTGKSKKKIWMLAVVGALGGVAYAAYRVSLIYLTFYSSPYVSVHEIHIFAPFYVGERMVVKGYLGYSPALGSLSPREGDVTLGNISIYATKDDWHSANDGAAVAVFTSDQEVLRCLNNYVTIIGTFDEGRVGVHSFAYGLINVESISAMENGHYSAAQEKRGEKRVDC